MPPLYDPLPPKARSRVGREGPEDWNPSIRAAVDVMGEARAYLELRGKLSGELGAPAAQQVTIAKIQVLALPKCPGVSS